MRRWRRRGHAVPAVAAALAATAAVGATVLIRRRVRQRDRQFRLRPDERVAAGLKRIAHGQLDSAIERLEGRTAEDLETVVHEARKSIKRLRAVLRLARDELGKKTYRRENRAFRDAGRRLSGARDATVILATLEGLAERYAGELTPHGHLLFWAMLADEREAARRRLEQSTATADVVAELRRARERVSDWPLRRKRTRLANGFERIYRRGRRAYTRAKKKPTTERLHELRKRTKDLWYAAQILRPYAPKRMKRIARDAHELSELIGEDHDLALLAARVESSRDRFSDPAAADELCRFIARRRGKLRRDAKRVAKRVYREKPLKLARPLR